MTCYALGDYVCAGTLQYFVVYHRIYNFTLQFTLSCNGRTLRLASSSSLLHAHGQLFVSYVGVFAHPTVDRTALITLETSRGAHYRPPTA